MDVHLAYGDSEPTGVSVLIQAVMSDWCAIFRYPQ
jgi:hypothetical protein